MIDKKMNDIQITCICGSTTLKNEILDLANGLTLNGSIVLCPLVFSHYDNIELFEYQITLLKNLHLKKIDMCDKVICIYRDKIGDGLKKEIEYAKSKNKNILIYKLK